MKILSENILKNFSAQRPANADYYRADGSPAKKHTASFWTIVKIGSVFAGAVLGAGFAGGKELVIFFVRYGEKGVIASLLAGVLFLILGTSIIYKSKATSSEAYSSYLKQIFPVPIASFIGIISDLFLLMCFIIMLSGAGALFKECFHVPTYIGSILAALTVFLVLKGGMSSISTVCSILTPIMVIGIIVVDIFAIYTETVSVFASGLKENGSFLLSSVLYVSYNMLSSAPVLCSASSLAHNKKTAVLGGFFGGIILSIIAFASCIALHLTSSEILKSELPFLLLSSKLYRSFHIFYALILYIAILTTAFSSGFPIIKKAERYIHSTNISSLLLCVSAIPLSFLKFSVLVEKCYTFFGILGLLLIVAIFYDLIIKSTINRYFSRKS